MLRRWNARFAALWLLLGLLSRAEAAELSRYDRVVVEPTKTSIYVGSVSLKMPPFVRREAVYATTYTAKLRPYFFYSETGELWITIPDDDLRRLERGETIEFEGRARNDRGHYRGISGRAVPANATSGKLKVRVFVTETLELIFNTTYRFVGP